MELDHYLSALKACPMELLKVGRQRPLWRVTAEFGVFDNWPVLLNANFDDMLHHLENSDFTVVEKRDNDSHVVLYYNPGVVELQAWNHVARAIGTLDSSEHYQRQHSDYTMAMMLHPYQEKKIIEEPWVHTIARVIGILGNYALEHNIPLCFPASRGLDRYQDLSQIVYHP